MNPIFFISDAHLGLGKKEKEARQERLLLEFLEYVEKTGEGLYIVGDLFDFWFEYRSVVPRRYLAVLTALKRITTRGIDIKYITGNHDFWMEDFLEDAVGIQIHREPLTTRIDGKQFYIAHGDGLAKRDVGYRVLKRILRHPLNIRLYRLLHPDVGFAVARFFSQLSRNHREIKDRDAEYLQFAKDRFGEGFDCVVLAHTHRPQEYHEDGKSYINTGDWMEHFTYGLFENGRLSMKSWYEGTNRMPDPEHNTRPKV